MSPMRTIRMILQNLEEYCYSRTTPVVLFPSHSKAINNKSNTISFNSWSHLFCGIIWPHHCATITNRTTIEQRRADALTHRFKIIAWHFKQRFPHRREQNNDGYTHSAKSLLLARNIEYRIHTIQWKLSGLLDEKENAECSIYTTTDRPLGRVPTWPVCSTQLGRLYHTWVLEMYSSKSQKRFVVVPGRFSGTTMLVTSSLVTQRIVV